jgi:signal transduction histidine kinase
MTIPSNLDFANEVKQDRLITIYRFTMGLSIVILVLLIAFGWSSNAPETLRIGASVLTLVIGSLLTSVALRQDANIWAPRIYSFSWFVALTIMMTTEDANLVELVPFFFPVIIFIVGLLLSPAAMLNMTVLAAGIIIFVPALATNSLIAISTFQAFAIFLTILSAILAAQATGELYQISEWALQNYQKERRTNDELFEKRQELQRSLRRSEALGDKLQDTLGELQLAHQQAEEAKNFRGQFLANMSHELRTPLNAIIGFSETMLHFPMMYNDEKLPDTYERDLSQIFASGQQLLYVINDILDLAKVDAGKLEIHMEETSVDAILQAVQSTARGLVKDKPVKLEQNLPDTLPTVWADSSRLRQVLLNFYSNACKYTDEGSITLNVEIDSDYMTFAVKDTGEGIPEDFHDKLFQEFTQVSSGGRDPRSGTGLGLAIAKQLVDLMGGDIWMESEFGKGSTFYFKVQLFKDQDKDLSESNSSSNTQTEKIPVSEIEDAKERVNQASQQTSQPITQQASQKESQTSSPTATSSADSNVQGKPV